MESEEEHSVVHSRAASPEEEFLVAPNFIAASLGHDLEKDERDQLMALCSFDDNETVAESSASRK